MDYFEFLYKRITELRMKKGVSARDMSLSLGQSESYINKIENKRTLPSFAGFIYICEYLGVTPQEFFDVQDSHPVQSNEIITMIKKLPSAQAEHILQVIKDLSDKT